MTHLITLQVKQLNRIESPMWYRIMLNDLLTKHGTGLVKAELMREAAAMGDHVVSIAAAEDWPRLKQCRDHRKLG